MSEYEYDDAGAAADDAEGGLEDYAPVDDSDAGQEWSGVPYAEWQDAQERLAQVDELLRAVQWQAEQDAAASQQAQYEQWLGDPLDDPVGYAGRIAQLSGAASQAEQAQFFEAVDAAADEYRMSQARDELDSLIGHHPD